MRRDSARTLVIQPEAVVTKTKNASVTVTVDTAASQKVKNNFGVKIKTNK